jgi:hypothetical protein
MIKIDKGVRRPKSVAKFFARNHFARTLNKHAQDLERLLYSSAQPHFAQFARTNVISKTPNECRRKLGLYRHRPR